MSDLMGKAIPARYPDERQDITVVQLAAILQCSRGQIYKLIDEKRLPALKVGTLVRLDPAQVAAWIRSRMTIAA